MIRFVRLLSLFLLVSFAIGTDAAESRLTVSLMLICDIYNMSADRNGRGGMARVAGVISAERKKGGHLIVAHAGDTISPSLMSGIDRGAHMIDLLNQLRPDIFVPGNHEFDFGPDVFRKRMAEARFPVLAANLAGANDQPLEGIASHRLIKAGPVTLGIIGLTDENSPQRSSPGDLIFHKALDSARRLAGRLRKQGADLIVLVTHTGRPLDNLLIRERIADVILSGDDHDLVLKFDGKTAFAEAMEEGRVVVAVDLDVTVKGEGENRKVRWWPRFRVIDTADVKPDAAMAAKVAAYEKTLSAELDVTLGTTSSELDSNNAAVRGGEAAIGNLFADILRKATKADAALINGGGIRGKRIYRPGDAITRRHVLAELPFGNKTYLLIVTGATLRRAIEQGLAGAENLTGAFPQVSGLTIRADLSRPVGSRLVRLDLNGAPVKPDQTIHFATNDFLARGGDGYTALKDGRILIGETEANLMASQVMSYIKETGTVSASVEGRIVLSRVKKAE